MAETDMTLELTDDAGDALPYLGQGSLRDRVVDVLEQRILDGSFPPGSRIPTEAMLGERFGVSRTVVRDALRVLEVRGLIEIRRGTGTRVRSTTVDTYVGAAAMLLLRSELTVGDLLDARETLESQLALVAAANHTAENCERMEKALEEFAAAVGRRDPAEAARSHVAFHTELCRATRLPAFDILLGPLQQMMLATSLVPSGIAADDPRGWRVAAHRQLVTAIESRSVDAVNAATAEHWNYTREQPFEQLRRRRVSELYTSPRELIAESQLGRES